MTHFPHPVKATSATLGTCVLLGQAGQGGVSAAGSTNAAATAQSRANAGAAIVFFGGETMYWTIVILMYWTIASKGNEKGNEDVLHEKHVQAFCFGRNSRGSIYMAYHHDRHIPPRVGHGMSRTRRSYTHITPSCHPIHGKRFEFGTPLCIGR